MLPQLAVIDGPIVWLILILAVLLFGGSKLPELARGLGKAKREFRKASEEVEDEVRTAVDEDERRKERLRQVEEEERAKVRARIEEEERQRRQGDGKSN
ncbi:MAG: twin-arginine translocase TatA/TatE family subunit [Opitutales bacterium]|jgi:sec-independent protein translocase protein TatA